MPVEGKVVLIVDDRTIVINRGYRDGVRHGMRFAVVAPLDEVTDPDTGESLGRWEGVKARLVAVHVQERLAVLAPEEQRKESSLSDLTHTLSAEMVRVSSALTGTQALEVDRSQMTGMPSLGPVRKGDVVRQIE